MSLITCPECGGDISDKAATCPHCGAPVARAAIDADLRSAAATGLTVFQWGRRLLSLGLFVFAIALVVALGSAVLDGNLTAAAVFAVIALMLFGLGSLIWPRTRFAAD